MTIYEFPLEPLEERYSIQWRKWFEDYFVQKGIRYERIEGETKSSKINVGAFLDVFETNRYKLTQMAEIIDWMPVIEDKDVFFFHDIWNPAVVNLKYMLDGAGIKARIFGCIHAGSYDESDFLYRMGMARWARSFEKSLIDICDGVFVATEFHRKLLIDSGFDGHKVLVSGFPIFQQRANPVEKENIVVFPHRMDPEKQPGIFEKMRARLQDAYKDWKFVFSKEVTKTKQEYFDLLQSSKIAVSFALQETWGIAMQEAVFADCIPLVPKRLSYEEMYPELNQFESIEEAEDILCDMIENYPTWLQGVKETKDLFTSAGRRAIPNIVNFMINRED